MLLSRNVCNFFLEKQFNSKNLIELKKKEEDYKEVDILAHVMKDEYVDIKFEVGIQIIVS